MSVYRLSTSKLLTLAGRTVANSRSNPTVSKAVAIYGYGEKAFAEGEARLEALNRAILVQRGRYADKRSATSAVNEAREVLHREHYLPHVTIARLAFKEGTARRRLGLKGRRPEALHAWMQAVGRFYDTLLGDAELMQSMARYGITKDRLQAARQKARALAALDRRRERLKVEAREATSVRNKRHRALADWLADYQKIARIALVDTPDMVEQFGLSAPS